MSTWTLKEKSTGELEVVIEGEEWAKAVEKAFNKLAKNVTIHGFRKGCAPKALVEKQISMGERQAAAIDEHINEWLKRGLEETGVEPISQPSADIRDLSTEKAVLVYTFQVMPEVTVTDYRGLHYAMAETSVSDEEVTAELDRMRKQYADMEEKEGTAENGDIVNINYEGFKGEEAFEGGKADNYDLTLGSGSFIPGFEDQLIGATIGNEIKVNVKFPEEYHSEELKGKDAVFECTVKSIKKKVLPELNDDFAKKASTFQTLDELKADIKSNLEKSAEAKAESAKREAAIKQAADNAEVDVPEVMVENRVNAMIQQMALSLQQQGMSLEMYLQYTNSDMAKLRENYKETAATNVKVDLMLEAVAKAEGIKVEAEDLDEQVNAMAATYGATPAQVRQIIAEQGRLGELTGSVLRSKTAKFIVDSVAE